MKKRLILVLAIIFMIPAFSYAGDFEVNKELIYSGNTFYGEAVSSKSGKSWPLAIEFWQLDSTTNEFEGMISWPTINSVNAIEGNLSKKKFYFRETEYIKKGRAHLKVEYFLNIKGDTVYGKYKDPAGDYGKIQIKLRYDGRKFDFRANLRQNPTYFGHFRNGKRKTPFDMRFNGQLVTELQDFQGMIITREKKKTEFKGIFMYGVLEITEKNVKRPHVYKLHFNFKKNRFEGKSMKKSSKKIYLDI